jgi:hypothetical protein
MCGVAEGQESPSAVLTQEQLWRCWDSSRNDLVFVVKGSSSNIIRVIKPRRLSWTGHIARTVVMRVAYRILVGKLQGRRPLERPRRRCVDNIKIYLRDVGCGGGGGMDWIDRAQDRDRWRAFVNVVMNLQVSWNVGNFLSSWEPVSFSWRSLWHGVS